LLKRRLVSAVLGSLREIRAPGWALSEAYQMYMTRFNDDAVSWVPELDYYIRLVQRIVESKQPKFYYMTIHMFTLLLQLCFYKLECTNHYFIIYNIKTSSE